MAHCGGDRLRRVLTEQGGSEAGYDGQVTFSNDAYVNCTNLRSDGNDSTELAYTLGRSIGRVLEVLSADLGLQCTSSVP